MALPLPDPAAGLLGFETLISDASALLMAVPPEQAERLIERTLDRVRSFFDADRCVLLRVSEDHRSVHVHLASYAAGIPPVSQELNLAELFPWAARRLLVDRMPVRISRLDDLPPEAAPERPNWEAMAIRSSLVLPIEAGPDVRWLIVLNAVKEERAWPDEFVKRFRVLGEMLAGCLARVAMIVRLRDAEARLKSGAELADLAHYEVDFSRGNVHANERFYDICGIPEACRGRIDSVAYWLERIHPDDRALVLEERDRLFRGDQEKLSVEYRYLHPHRGERWLQHVARVASRDGSRRMTASNGVFRDVTEHKRADAELADLSHRLIRAQEEERAMIARELHDDVTQRLAVLAIDAGRAELASRDEEQAGAMRALREGLARISEDVHALAYQLHSSVLDELGLAEAIRAACERLRKRGGVDVSLDVDPALVASGREVGLCLVRVAQEALNNVARHSRARTVAVTLRQMEGGIVLAVRDDGVGFDLREPRPARGLGLLSMRERLRLVHGSLDVESEPGAGCTVVAWAPAPEMAP